MRIIIICIVIAVIYCIYDRHQTNKRAAQDNVKQRLEDLEAFRNAITEEVVAALKRIDRLENALPVGKHIPDDADM